MFNAVERFLRWFLTFIFRVEVVNPENLPENGAGMLCLNHISAWDPPVVCAALERTVRFLAKHELFKIPVVSWVLKSLNTIPVKHSAGDIGAVKASLKALKNGEIIGIFPTGTRERIHKNAPVKPGVAFIAVKSGVPVIPAYIKANYRPFSKVKIILGKPMSFSEYADSRPTQEELASIADKIYASILGLGDEN